MTGADAATNARPAWSSERGASQNTSSAANGITPT